jgi:Cu/Zn superoxide dismutase
MSRAASANSGAGIPAGPHRIWSSMARRARLRLGAAAAGSGALAAVAMITLVAPAGASTTSAGTSTFPAVRGAAAVNVLALQAMPYGTVTFSRGSHGRLMAHARVIGLTPGSAHNVDLLMPGRLVVVRFSPLVANGGGQAYRTLASSFVGNVPPGSRLVIRMGTSGRVGNAPIAQTTALNDGSRRAYRLIALEVTAAGVSYGMPRGVATVTYDRRHHTLTVVVSASGLTPGPHAAHVHVGSCRSQGAVKYMLRDLVANRLGRIVRAVRVFTHVPTPPVHGWYLNIHQGTSSNILLSNGQPSIYFRPLLCADINGARTY